MSLAFMLEGSSPRRGSSSAVLSVETWRTLTGEISYFELNCQRPWKGVESHHMQLQQRLALGAWNSHPAFPHTLLHLLLQSIAFSQTLRVAAT
jgi:hypothetical protein